MTHYNHSSSYNRTFERKVIEEGSGAANGSPHSTASPLHTIKQTLQSSGFPTHHLMGSVAGTGSLGGLMTPHNYHFGSTATSGSYNASDESLHVVMDVSSFGAEDLKVSVVGSQIVVEGRHAEKSDELGSIERHFVRKFQLPRLASPETVTSNLTADGQLTVTAEAPRMKVGGGVGEIV